MPVTSFFENFVEDLKIYAIMLRKIEQGRSRSKPLLSPVDIQFKNKILPLKFASKNAISGEFKA